MSVINHNNRPQYLVPLAGAASKKIPLLYAHKKMRVVAVALLTVGAIPASGSAYSTLKLQKSASGAAPADIADHAATDTQAGVLANGALNLDASPDIILEIGEILYLDHALTGSLTLDAYVSLDCEVVGN